ncbi:MAG: biotin synthase BioB [Planctomycetes bacterium]|nr:biotin synthase BioB [Planctomycetota bacterium]
MEHAAAQDGAAAPVGPQEAMGWVRADLEDLIARAWEVRRARFGRDVAFCSIGAGKVGACSEDCKWCSQSARHVTHVDRTVRRTDPQTLIAAARQAGGRGVGRFGIVNSGREPMETDLAAVEAVAGGLNGGDVELCASLGRIDAATAARLRAAGVRRYHHNLETSRRFYGRMVSTHTWDDRLAALKAARQGGLSLCSGGLFGLGETWADRIDLAIALRDEVRPDAVPLNFLHPIPGTPLADAPRLTPAECLRIIAVFRLLMPDVDLKVAGGREANLRDLQSWIFHAGATSVMVGDYLTTRGRGIDADLQMVTDLNLRLVGGFGQEAAP